MTFFPTIRFPIGLFLLNSGLSPEFPIVLLRRSLLDNFLILGENGGRPPKPQKPGSWSSKERRAATWRSEDEDSLKDLKNFILRQKLNEGVHHNLEGIRLAKYTRSMGRRKEWCAQCLITHRHRFLRIYKMTLHTFFWLINENTKVS